MIPLADIVGDNAVHTITLGSKASFIQFQADGGTVRIGSISTVSSSFGFPIFSGGGDGWPVRGAGSLYWYGPTIYAYVPVGATLYIAYADATLGTY